MQLADNEQITNERTRWFPLHDPQTVASSSLAGVSARHQSPIAMHRLYAEGKRDSRQNLTDRERTFLEGILKSRFTDNICNLIIATASDRLILERFQVDDDKTQLWLDEDLYIKNKIGALNGETHYATLRDGNFCLYPWWSARANRVVVFEEQWWDGLSGMFVAYDDEGLPAYAVKQWTVTQDGASVHRRVVWFEDRMERYQSTSGTEWEPYTFPGESGPVTMLVRADGSPMGIPVVHFSNGGKGPGYYGDSELDGGPEGFQDQIDHLHYSITMTARQTGFQTTWSAGVGKATDEDGNPVPLQTGPGAHWAATDATASFGYIPAGSIEEQIKAYHLKRGSVCQATRTPAHYITGIWPSGEALYRAELPLIDKVTKQREKLDPSWTTLAHRATEIANVYGKAGLNEEAMIKAVFADVEKRDPFTLAAAEQAQANAVGAWVSAQIPLEIILKRGKRMMDTWTDEELADLAKARAAESQNQASQAESALAAFQQGR